MVVFVVLFKELNMGRKKYNEGSSINIQKNYKSINDLNIGVSGSVSGSKGNIYSRANINFTPRDSRFSVGASRSFPPKGKPETSFSASYKPDSASEITYTQSGKTKFLTYNRRLNYGRKRK